MQFFVNNKMVVIIFCVVILLVLLVGYYILYFCYCLIYCYNLEQVLEINKQVFLVFLFDGRVDWDIVVSLVKDMFEMVNELLFVDVLGVVVYSEDNYSLNYVFLLVEDENEEMCEMMVCSFDVKIFYWCEKDRVKCLFLWVEVGNENCCMGVLVLKIVLFVECEDDCLMLEFVVGYVVIIVYNVVVLMVQKYWDIESVQDDVC